jgi:hypothetical protein
MIALVGFAVGYAVGAQQGREGLAKMIAAWQQIQASDEFAAAIETGKNVLSQTARSVLSMGTGEVKNLMDRRLRAA